MGGKAKGVSAAEKKAEFAEMLEKFNAEGATVLQELCLSRYQSGLLRGCLRGAVSVTEICHKYDIGAASANHSQLD